MHYRLPFGLSFVIVFMILIMSWKVYGYAEIHYIFYQYSLLNRRYPEILLDAPWRVDAGIPIPIVCIVKDADRFPVKLRRITARYKINSGETHEKVFLDEHSPLYITDQYWSKFYFIQLPDGQTGNLRISVEIEFVRDGIKRTMVSDNFPRLSHAPLRVFVSPWKLPSFDGWYGGDPHYHSDMTQDQVEFGAPVEVAAVMGKAMGLNWLAVADHSYDLDRAMGEYFQYDSGLARWRKVHEDASLVNSRNDGFVVIPAEEVSCGNSRSHNIHLLAFDTPQFIPGSGDGVKRGLNKRPTLTLRQCLNRINEAGGFAYAAHPEMGNGFLGMLMLNRGCWRDPDYAQGGYSGMQIWNGMQGKVFMKSREKWIQLLLEGRRLFVLGGNDAHGDFNRCRKVKYPNTRLMEDYDHIFGKVRTYAYCDTDTVHSTPTVAEILDALRNGRTVITNGPVAILQAQDVAGRMVNIGDDAVGREFTLMIRAGSSEEFGPIGEVNLYRGDLVEGTEQIERIFVPEEVSDTTISGYDCTFIYRMAVKNRCYVRVEATSSARGEEYTCLTNPIWLRFA